MKHIGYVIKYNEVQGKGLLAFGHWKKNGNPLLFSHNDCISKVKSGALVFFELNENKALKIERASLNNFDKNLNLIESLENSGILYEDLTTIIPDNYIEPKIDPDSGFHASLEELCGRNLVKLPEDIESLYSYFGKYDHFKDFFDDFNDSIYIDIFNISHWVDSEIINEKYFGETIEEMKYLCDSFLIKVRIGIIGQNLVQDQNISKSWIYLLSKIKYPILIQIIKYAPVLRNAIPNCEWSKP